MHTGEIPAGTQAAVELRHGGGYSGAPDTKQWSPQRWVSYTGNGPIHGVSTQGRHKARKRSPNDMVFYYPTSPRRHFSLLHLQAPTNSSSRLIVNILNVLLELSRGRGDDR